MATLKSEWVEYGNFRWLEVEVKITFVEGVLGTMPSDPQVYETYIASKAPKEDVTRDEVSDFAVETDRSGTTVFPIDEDGREYLYDYQIKGYFKDTCGTLRRDKAGKSISSSIKAYKKDIDGLIFIKERKIPFVYDGQKTYCQRPLRASTPQGERVALACSEEIPAGATLHFTVLCKTEEMRDAVYEWLDYGIFRGMGQWRNSGKGRFVWEPLNRISD